MRRPSRLLCATLAFIPLLLLTLGPSAARGAESAGAPLPVVKVVLYKHGMGYVERRGAVRDDATLAFGFRADQMKDLLTSFYAVDLGGGTVTSIRYDTAEPLARRLQEILVKVPENAALSQFLPQLKGAVVKVASGGEEVSGRLLGLEPVQEAVEGRVVRQAYRLVLLTDGGTVRAVDLAGISRLEIADRAVREDLARLLDLTLEGKRADGKRLTVTTAGRGERQVQVGYLVEMPVWKCSYRLILDGGDPGKALLQGWAQAENTSGEDWRDVGISFVAGNPLSFAMDLYTPLYVSRPQVPVPGLQNLAVNWGVAPPPETVAEGASQMRKGARLMERSLAPPAPAAAAFAPQKMDQVLAEAAVEGRLGEVMAAGVASAAQGQKLGELFSYRARDPVSIPAGQAALVPIVAGPTKGKRVLLFQPSFSPRPVNAWVLANDTDLTLEAGPVTFFEGSSALGEGILGHTLPPGGQEVIPYAADASVDVTPRSDSRLEPYLRGTLVDGVLELVRTEVLATTWRAVNRGLEKTVLWLHHPRNPLYTLAKPEKALKEVEGHYRFELALAPGETRDFQVEERRELREAVALSDADETRLSLFAAAPYLSPRTRELLAGIRAVLAERAALRRQVEEWQGAMERLREEEGRLRANIQTVGYNQPREAELRAKWMSALSAAEEKLAELRGKVDEAAAAIRRLEEEAAARIRDFRE